MDAPSGQTTSDTGAPQFLLEIDVSKWRKTAHPVFQQHQLDLSKLYLPTRTEAEAAGTGTGTLTFCNYLVILEELFKPVHEDQTRSCRFTCTTSSRITTPMNSSVSEILEGGSCPLAAFRTTEADVVADPALEFNHR